MGPLSGQDAPVAQHAHWLHEMRNAVNAGGVTVALAKRLLDRGDTAAAADMLGHADAAWGRCRDLLAAPVNADQDAVPDDAGLPLMPRAEAAEAPSAPPSHR